MNRLQGLAVEITRRKEHYEKAPPFPPDKADPLKMALRDNMFYARIEELNWVLAVIGALERAP